MAINNLWTAIWKKAVLGEAQYLSIDPVNVPTYLFKSTMYYEIRSITLDIFYLIDGRDLRRVDALQKDREGQ